jgi:hypothetical protein
MEVKIYREPENVGLLLDENELAEYQQLAEELGIPEVKQGKTPSVYQTLNQVQIRALEALCPAKTSLEEYNRSTIPVEVLRALKFIKENEMFDFIKVWFDNKNPDPLIVGERYRTQNDREKEYTWNTEKVLVARWGDCAYELPELVEMGKERLKREFTEKAIDKQQKIESFLQHPEVYVNKYLNEGYINFERD